MLRGEKCNIPLPHMHRTTPCLLQIFKSTGFRKCLAPVYCIPREVHPRLNQPGNQHSYSLHMPLPEKPWNS